MTGSNRRPSACKADALPAELILQLNLLSQNLIGKLFSLVRKNFGDPYGTRTRVTSVKGRCLNHLTKGPKYMAEKKGFEPSRRLLDLLP